MMLLLLLLCSVKLIEGCRMTCDASPAALRVRRHGTESVCLSGLDDHETTRPRVMS